MNVGKALINYFIHLATSKEIARHVKQTVCNTFGLTEEEVAVEVSPSGDITVTCRPKAKIKTMEIAFALEKGDKT